ncbi:hypothetical protein Efla_007300 [Eimeria flavescens]
MDCKWTASSLRKDILAAKGVDIRDGLEVHLLFPTDILAATTLDFPDGLQVHLLIPTDILAAKRVDIPDGLEVDRLIPTYCRPTVPVPVLLTCMLRCCVVAACYLYWEGRRNKRQPRIVLNHFLRRSSRLCRDRVIVSGGVRGPAVKISGPRVKAREQPYSSRAYSQEVQKSLLLGPPLAKQALQEPVIGSRRLRGKDGATPGVPSTPPPRPVGTFYLKPAPGAEKALLIMTGDSTPWKQGDPRTGKRDSEGKKARGTVWDVWILRNPGGPGASQEPSSQGDQPTSEGSHSSSEGSTPASSSGTSGRPPEQTGEEGDEGSSEGKNP